MSQPNNGDELIGRTLGQFEILEEIGRGGMATVYRARQLSMNRVVAVKVLPRHLLHDPGFYERFLREVEVISQLEHPHILPIYDYGQVDGIPFIAMRYLGGGSLDQVIRRALPTLTDIEKPLRQIAQALDHAHRQGIVHRDLKPGNIMLDEHGNAYLSDFGIARVLGSQLTGSLIVGTPTYMSPEQANGVPIDGRSDIYALGVVLFELLTGRAPYQAETPMAVLLKHINEPMPPVGQYRSSVPPAVNAVVQKATAKDPDDRYPSATAMIDALRDALRDTAAAPPASPDDPTLIESADALAKAATAAAHKTAPTTEPTPAQAAPQPAPGGASRGGLVLGALLLILIALGGAVALMVSAGGQATDAVPTPFPRASTITHPRYTLSIPDAWIPPSQFLDRSADDRLIHLWQATDNTASVTLTILNAPVVDDNAYRNILDAEDRRFRALPGRAFISESVAEDGTVRRSYLLDGTTGLPPGQVDLFYLRRGEIMAILELYTATVTLNDLVPTLQQVLDSLRLAPPPST